MIYTYSEAKKRLRQVFTSDAIIECVENDLSLPSYLIPSWEAQEAIITIVEFTDYAIDHIKELIEKKIDTILFIHEIEERTDRITCDDGLFFLNGERLEQHELMDYLSDNWKCEVIVE